MEFKQPAKTSIDTERKLNWREEDGTWKMVKCQEPTPVKVVQAYEIMEEALNRIGELGVTVSLDRANKPIRKTITKFTVRLGDLLFDPPKPCKIRHAGVGVKVEVEDDDWDDEDD